MGRFYQNIWKQKRSNNMAFHSTYPKIFQRIMTYDIILTAGIFIGNEMIYELEEKGFKRDNNLMNQDMDYDNRSI